MSAKMYFIGLRKHELKQHRKQMNKQMIAIVYNKYVVHKYLSKFNHDKKFREYIRDSYIRYIKEYEKEIAEEEAKKEEMEIEVAENFINDVDRIGANIYFLC